LLFPVYWHNCGLFGLSNLESTIMERRELQCSPVQPLDHHDIYTSESSSFVLVSTGGLVG